MSTNQKWDRQTAQALPDMEVTHFHFLRHGRVETGGKRLVYGHLDLPLSEEGWQQGLRLIEFAAENVPKADGVLSSDLQRCLKIARPLAEAHGLPLEVFPELREQNMGQWEGKSWAELTGEDVARVRAYWSDYANTAPPGGESFSDLVERFSTFLASRMGKLKGRRWIVVAHTGIVRAALCHLMGLPPSEGLRFAPLPGTHTWLIWAESGAVIQTLGERPRSMSFGAAGATHSGEARTQGAIRLALSGSAGTGKTTLGQSLAEHWGVPFIPEGMRARIEAGLQLHQLSRVELKALVSELWDERCRREDEALATVGGFVADRSPIDYLVFWLHYGFTSDVEGTQLLMDQVRQRSQGYDRIVVLPWGVLPLCSDGVRSSNPWLQLHFQSAVEGLLNREIGSPIVVELPPLDDLEARKRWVIDQVQEAGVRTLGSLPLL